MNPRLIAAILLGKLIISLSRFFKVGGGSAAPGLYALKIYPQLVSDLASKIPHSIVITGTNGKTTTARMLAHFAQNSGLKVLRNATGSNLERGIASALIQHSSFHLGGGGTKYDLAIWELDEAAFNQVVLRLKPQQVVILNVFRDQLDRYGEVDSVLKNWHTTLRQLSPETTLLLNGDDQNLLSLISSFPGKALTFGVENYKIRGEKSFKRVGKEILNLEAKNLNLLGFEGVRFELEEGDGRWFFSLPLPGIYHIYDFLAAYITATRLGIERQSMIGAMQSFSPAFGRTEKITLPGEKTAFIQLIKNPTGASQVLEVLSGELREDDKLLLALNDNLADGTDVSWIWDVDFELLQNPSRAKRGDLKTEIASGPMAHRNDIIVSGSRAEDLALRLKYAGISPQDIEVENNLKKALKQATDGLKGRLFILPTYTALLKLQAILAEAGIKEHYWKHE
ncbi:MAG: MurT ligase domain-containing protein [bacterium]|nr:MurT ligase domain-containing protein [bacterium]